MRALATNGDPTRTSVEHADDPERSRREELIGAAVDLFASNGYKGTSIRDIANALGVSVSNIYNYFENKEALWLAVLEHSIKDLPQKLRSVWDIEMDPVSRFRLLIKTHLATSGTHQKESKIFFFIDEGHLSEEAVNKNKAIQTKVLDVYVRALEELREAGCVSTPEVKLLALSVLGVINWYLRWYRADGRLSAEQVQEEIANFMLHGVLGDANRPGCKDPACG
ncbi:MAG: TetR/AcrR family transcriptional regulator [Deltaproteobacteria bacterium]|nr:TetR/AcrR family transcriptional regulator [Deltaproteobacteria bacterium]